MLFYILSIKHFLLYKYKWMFFFILFFEKTKLTQKALSRMSTLFYNLKIHKLMLNVSTLFRNLKKNTKFMPKVASWTSTLLYIFFSEKTKLTPRTPTMRQQLYPFFVMTLPWVNINNEWNNINTYKSRTINEKSSIKW